LNLASISFALANNMKKLPGEKQDESN